MLKTRVQEVPALRWLNSRIERTKKLAASSRQQAAMEE